MADVTWYCTACVCAPLSVGVRSFVCWQVFLRACVHFYVSGDERERGERHAGERGAYGVPSRMPPRDVRPDEPLLDL